MPALPRVGPLRSAGALVDKALTPAREVARVPLALAKLPAAGVHRVLGLSGAIRRGYDELAERGLSTFTAFRGPLHSPAADGESAGDDSSAEPSPREDIVTRAVEAVGHAPRGPEVEREELPIPDFDHLTVGSLRGRLRALDLAELQALRSYEQEHAKRLPILTMLENRIAKLESTSSA
jgi:hypothetical protein